MLGLEIDVRQFLRLDLLVRVSDRVIFRISFRLGFEDRC